MSALHQKHTISFTAQWNGMQETNRTFKTSYRIAELLVQGIEKDTLPFLTHSYINTLYEEIEQCLPLFSGMKNLVVLGIGGSAIGTRALLQSLYPEQEWGKPEKKVWIIDNLDEYYMGKIFQELRAEETIVLVISKSGETIETISQYFMFKEWLEKHLQETWKKHCILITDAQSGFLRSEAIQHSLTTASIHAHLGGRYSVISAVGIMPLVFLGINYTSLIEGAKEFTTTVIDTIENIENNPAWRVALWQFFAEQEGLTETIFFPYIPRFTAWGAWFSQLWAESLGKSGKGTMPIPAQGVIDQHSLQQMFLDGRKNKSCIFIRTAEQKGSIRLPNTLPKSWDFLEGKTIHEILLAEYLGTRSAFLQHNIPYIEYQIPEITPYHIGKMIALFETTTLITGYLLQINPLDQPAVEYGKHIAKKILHTTTMHSTIHAGDSVDF